jgi:acetyl esterase/lipase
MAFEYKSIYFDEPIVTDRAVDIFVPGKITREVALFFVHGGGWQAGSRAGYHKILRAFNAEGYVCATTDYRLSGVTISQQVADVRRGYEVFLSELEALGRPKKVAVYGGSAGAHLAALLALSLPGECGEPKSEEGLSGLSGKWIRPIGAALQATPVRFDPWEDIFPHIWRDMQKAAGDTYENNPGLFRKLAPINHISAESPPMFFLEAENEHMFPHEYILDFLDLLRAAGGSGKSKIYTKAEHGFFYDLTRRQQKEAFADLLEFFGSLK